MEQSCQPSITTKFTCFPCLGSIFSVIHWVCGTVVPHPHAWILSIWEQRENSSTIPAHNRLEVSFSLAKGAQWYLLQDVGKVDTHSFQPRAITPVTSSSQRSRTHLKRSHWVQPSLPLSAQACVQELRLPEIRRNLDIFTFLITKKKKKDLLLYTSKYTALNS